MFENMENLFLIIRNGTVRVVEMRRRAPSQ